MIIVYIYIIILIVVIIIVIIIIIIIIVIIIIVVIISKYIINKIQLQELEFALNNKRNRKVNVHTLHLSQPHTSHPPPPTHTHFVYFGSVPESLQMMESITSSAPAPIERSLMSLCARPTATSAV